MASPKDIEEKRRLEEAARKERKEAEERIVFEQGRRKNAAVARVTKDLEAAKRELAKKELEKNNIESEIGKASADAKKEEEKSKDDGMARKEQAKERREKTMEEEAIREIDKLEQEIKNAGREKKILEQKLEEIKRGEWQIVAVIRKTEMERSAAKNQERTLKNIIMQKKTRLTEATRQYENAKQTVARLERELQTAQTKGVGESF